MKALWLLLGLTSLLAQQVIRPRDEKKLKISMGSCNKILGDEPSVIFDAIREYEPDLFMWTGDVAYIDYIVFPPIWRTPRSPLVIAKKFGRAKNDPHYQALKQSGVPVIGVWDDHDFGINNGGGSFLGKEVMRQLWLDFIDEPKTSPRRTRSGMYESYFIGESHLVKMILIDNRYNRRDGDTLGEEQWLWLEKELTNSPKTKVFLIAFGIQALPDDRIIPEALYDEDRHRLFGIIERHNVSGVVLLSGDVHFGEILMLPCSRPRIGYQLYELTSSGMTHSLAGQFHIGTNLIDFILPDTYDVQSIPLRYAKTNFGSIEIDFDKKDPSIRLQVRSQDGAVGLEKYILLSEITQPSHKTDEFDVAKCPKLAGSAGQRWVNNFIKKFAVEKNIVQLSFFALFLLFILFVVYQVAKGLINWLLFFLELRKMPSHHRP